MSKAKLLAFDDDNNPKSAFSKLPAKGQSASVYLKYIESINAECSLWDKGAGYLNWLRGQVLIRAKASVQKGEFTEIEKATGLSRATIYNCMQIAKHFVEDAARTKGNNEMLAQLRQRDYMYKTPKRKGKETEKRPTKPAKRADRKINHDQLCPTLERIKTDALLVAKLPASCTHQRDRTIDLYNSALGTLAAIRATVSRVTVEFEKRITDLQTAHSPKRKGKGKKSTKKSSRKAA